jgi:hypothetical protein
MKLFKSLAVLAGCASAAAYEQCITCEFVGVAADEDTAKTDLKATTCAAPDTLDTFGDVKYTVSPDTTADDEKYCVSVFYMFEAKDIGNK